MMGNADDTVVTRRDVQFADHDGTKLLGDFYLPKRADKAPVLIAMHGGGWQHRSRPTYQYWGPYFAKHGIAVFEIAYRTAKAGIYPRAVYDVKSAIQFVRAHAAEYSLDSERIGLMGDSAGGHLAAQLSLAADQYTDDAGEPHRDVSTDVKVAICFYGVYDLLAQWTHDQLVRPTDHITEKFLDVSPLNDRKIYFESSPISYATIGRTKTRFLLIHGLEDYIVDPAQTKNFWQALNQARIHSRCLMIPGAGHFWNSEPFEDRPHSVAAGVAPRILEFLDRNF
jgi:acetyl esterase/lipase